MKKCLFFTDMSIKNGHVIRLGKLEVDSHTTDSMEGVNEPTKLRDLRWFLVLCNVFRHFVPNSSRIASPRPKKWRKGEPPTFFRELKDESKLFESLKQKSVEPPVFDLPRLNNNYTIDTDDWDKKIGFVLLQTQPDGKARPIGYWKRTLNTAEQSYETNHKYSLDFVWEVLLRPWLERARFTIRTDHYAQRWIPKMRDATGTLPKWI